MNTTLRTVTLGCKVNQYETELVREGLVRAGFVDAPAQEPADVCVVNTCTVTAEGDAKSRQAIRRLARENPDARIVVMGCYATRAPEEIAVLPGVVEVVTDKREIPDLLGRFGVLDIPDGISRFSNHHRAFIKVQDGCLLRCSYCIIPSVRPHMFSRPLTQILAEAQRLITNGYREIVLTGIHLGHYGVDVSRGKPKEQWTRLSHLVEQLALLPGDFRVRLSSIEATEVTRELLEVMQRYAGKVCPHLHLCLQSGSDRVLHRMRRRGGVRRFLDRCDLVRRMLKSPALTTDIIVGFPGETEADFQQTLRAARQAGFSKIHAFSFSPRRGTPAADLPDPVSAEVRSERMQRLDELGGELRRHYFRTLLQTTLEVLVETPPGSTLPLTRELAGTPHRAQAYGTACRYAPVLLTSAALNGKIHAAVVHDLVGHACLVASTVRDATRVP